MTKKATIIGINNYPQSPLTACVRDATAVEELLQRNGNGSPNFETRLHCDVQTQGELREIVDNLFKGEHEMALLYFSGHGYKQGKDTFLATPDAETHAAGLSVNDLLVMANSSKNKNKLVIIDCCYSGAAGNASILGDEVSVLGKGVTILTASSYEEESKEVVNRHGVFTNLLLQALGGGAANINGDITAGSIYAYIDQALGAHDQRPAFKTNVTGFVPLRSTEPQVPLKVLWKLTDYFPRPDYQFALAPSYEETNSDLVPQKVIEPQADPAHVDVFKDLQQYRSVGLVEPIDTPHMYYAAMRSGCCQLTPLGMHYWRLVKRGRI